MEGNLESRFWTSRTAPTGRLAFRGAGIVLYNAKCTLCYGEMSRRFLRGEGAKCG
jgi:hypothetical protein